MNYFSTQRVTTWTIFLLGLLNLATLTMLWTSHARRPRTPLPQQGTGRIERFLQQELGLTDEQARQFEELRQQHFKESKVVDDSIKRLKRKSLQEVFAASPDSDKLQALAEELGAKQTELETIRYRHFLDLKNLCLPRQVEKFQAIFHEIYPPEEPREPGRPPQPGGRPPEQRQQPPREAVSACQGESQGHVCRFQGPHGMVAGTCRQVGDQLACVPEDEQPVGPPPGQHESF